MRLAEKADSTLVLETSSKTGRKYLKIWVAACLFAATLLMCPKTACASYSVRIYGTSDWLAEIAERSLSAVAEKLPEEQSDATTVKVIEVVSGKLFTGYKVDSVRVESGEINVFLSPEKMPPVWKVEFQVPSIQDPAAGWFKSDIAKIEMPVASLIQNLPVESLNWCDTGLRDAILKIIRPVLPGWNPSMVVLSDSGNLTMRISFSPELPLVLAVNPNFTSASLPTLLHEELKADMMERSAPFIGLPVLWVGIHSNDLNLWTENILKDKNIIVKTAAESKSSFSAAQLSQMNVRVESKYYNIGAWAAVYAGTKDRSAEFGVHLGRRKQLSPNLNMEIYGEGILGLQDWNPEARLGLRFSFFKDSWLGAEWSTKDNKWWGRFSIDPRLHKTYIWFRIREDGEINSAVGWKATEYISLELHYDSRDKNSWGLRILGNM